MTLLEAWGQNKEKKIFVHSPDQLTGYYLLTREGRYFNSEDMLCQVVDMRFLGNDLNIWVTSRKHQKRFVVRWQAVDIWHEKGFNSKWLALKYMRHQIRKLTGINDILQEKDIVGFEVDIYDLNASKKYRDRVGGWLRRVEYDPVATLGLN